MSLAVDSRESIPNSTGKKKRSTTQPKDYTGHWRVKPKKSLFLDEIGDALVDQPTQILRHDGHLDDSRGTSFVSVADGLAFFSCCPDGSILIQLSELQYSHDGRLSFEDPGNELRQQRTTASHSLAQRAHFDLPRSQKETSSLEGK